MFWKIVDMAITRKRGATTYDNGTRLTVWESLLRHGNSLIFCDCFSGGNLSTFAVAKGSGAT
jgi:hypothetical protein